MEDDIEMYQMNGGYNVWVHGSPEGYEVSVDHNETFIELCEPMATKPSQEQCSVLLDQWLAK